MRFVNRETELQSLKNWYADQKAHLVILYGRRRVGKTQLCLEFVKNKPSIYFLAEQLPIDHQLLHLSKKVGEYFQDEILTTRGAQDWEQLFAYLAKKDEQLIVVIDEFPYLIQSEKGIASTFQKGWDLYLKDSPIFLILAGSSVSMMLEHTLEYKAPLYGRRTGQIQLKPFSFPALNQIFPKNSLADRLTIFSVAGGIPAYLKVFADRKEKLPKILSETIFEQDYFLSHEVEFLLRQELREPRTYLAILTAIANKCTRLSEIMNQTGLEKSTISRYLAILQDLDFVVREVPITEKYPSRSKMGSYQIKDNLTNFWFQFVFHHQDKLEQKDKKFLLRNFKAGKKELLASTYEKIAQDLVLKYENLFFRFERIGRWWDSHNEIDLVAFSKKENKILFGEAKWTNRPVGVNICEDLIEKSSQVKWGNTKTQKHYVLFSKSGFTHKMLKKAKKEKLVLFEEDKVIVP